ncbi:Transcription initiation factor IID 18kDa subunit [Macrophomina phaseolina MS6]|uniref:Transcription initiation factor IID 18kDa subunit n=1 Tax=Macrophomina phaseolina (strain MS6) TaxID=1126212 RepID=K2RIU6_MACPH|nr:Transcription initiation factor IID 18kDa subunit [Macrophomina phaseolina MS6]
MMFVAGDSPDAPVETTSLVENIVQQQVVELLSRSNDLAHRRGSKVISSDDIIFLIRHEKDKVSRLQTFLSWKELRKNAKDKDDKAGADVLDAVDGDLAEVDALPLDGASSDPSRKLKGPRVILPWDVSSYFSEKVPELDVESQETSEADEAQLRRLKLADERTQNMTREEYCEWAEARQATFTRRKRNRFRQWSGLGVVTDGKVGEDVMDILGFLTFQMVQTLTEEALRVKSAEQAFHSRFKEDGPAINTDNGPFTARHSQTEPVEPRHIREAFRRLQRSNVVGSVRPTSARSKPLKLVSPCRL